MIYKILIIIYIFIPIALMYFKKKEILALWILQGFVLDIFSVQWFGNISSFKITGIFLFVYQSKEIFMLATNCKIFKTFNLYIFLSIVTLVIFAFIHPWPNETLYSRISFSYLKGIKQVGTLISELGISFYLAKLVNNSKIDWYWIFKKLILLGFVALLGAFVERVVAIDLFELFTKGNPMLLPGRARGFSYEPRALSQVFSYLILILLAMKNIKLTYKIIGVGGFLYGMVLAKSMSGVDLLLIGLVILVIMFFRLKIDKRIDVAIVISALFVLLGFLSVLPINKEARQHYYDRLYMFSVEKSLGERFEPAESAVVNFFSHNPKYLFFGVGTGQSSIATSSYLSDYWKVLFPNGVTYLPFMGLLLNLANVGVVGLFLLIIYWLRGAAIVFKHIDAEIFVLFIVFICLYFFQVRYFHVLSNAILIQALLRENLYRNSAKC